MGLVIVPRDYVEGGGVEGMWNTTKSVAAGLIFEPDTGRRSLFYDGYSKQPIDWLGVPVRLDLLYFIAIIGTALISLASLLWSMGENFDSVAQGDAQFAINLDPNAHGTGTILGRYEFGLLNRTNEENMRQRIRKIVDRWVQSYTEDEQLQAIQDAWRKRILYESKLLVGLIATIAVLVAYVLILAFILVSEDKLSVSFSIGDEHHTVKLAFLPELLISLLDLLMTTLIAKIVKSEKRVRKNEEHSALLYRIFLTKIVSLGVILYSVAKVSNAAEGSVFKTATSGTICQEAEFGNIFLKLTFTDALMTVIQNYWALYRVNHGLPRLNYWFVVRRFQHIADKNRLNMLNQGVCGCMKRAHKFDPSIPGEIIGTDWEIRWMRAKTESNAQHKDGEYWFVKSTEWNKETKARDWTETTSRTRTMPREVKTTLRQTYKLQKRILPGETLSLRKQLMGEARKGPRVQWWKRTRTAGFQDKARPTNGMAHNAGKLFAWATSASLQRLTAGSLRSEHLGICAMLLLDAGFKSKVDVINSNKNPEELADAVCAQRGKHRVQYKNPSGVKQARRRQVSVAQQQRQSSPETREAQIHTRLEAFMTMDFQLESITDADQMQVYENIQNDVVSGPHGTDTTAQRCFLVLHHGILTYYYTKDPHAAYAKVLERKRVKSAGLTSPKTGENDTANSRADDGLDEAELAELCHEMSEHLGQQKRQVHCAMTHMCKGSKHKKRIATASAFENWWDEHGGNWVTLQPPSGILNVAHCTRIQAFRSRQIRVECGRRIFVMSPIANSKEALAMEAGESVWLQTLQASLVPQLTPNWGDSLQYSEEDAHGAQALTRRRLLRLAEAHVAAGHAHASGPGTPHLREIFDDFDADGNGFLTTDELMAVLQRLHTAQLAAEREQLLEVARNRGKAETYNLTRDLQTLAEKHEEQSACDKLTDEDLRQRVESIPKRVSGRVDFDEFVEWWNDQKGRNRISRQLLEARHMQASKEFRFAIEIYDQLLVPLTVPTTSLSGIHAHDTGASSKVKSGPTDTGKRAYRQMDVATHTDRTGQNMLGDGGREIAFRERSRAGTLDYSNQQMARCVKILLRRKRILELCKDAEDALAGHAHNRDYHGQLLERRRAVNRAAALLSYEAALTLDELNVHLQRKCSQLTHYINHSARTITRHQILVFATELVNSTGKWQDVSDEVDQQRFWKSSKSKLGSAASANLLTSMLYRQSLIWVRLRCSLQCRAWLMLC